MAQIVAAALLWAANLGAGNPAALADPTSGAAQRGSRPSLDGPNSTSEADREAGQFLDSLFAPLAPADPLPNAVARAAGIEPSKASRRPSWTARLARNPHSGDGNPPYVLIDRYGGIQRYVEPVDQIDLEKQVGKVVTVRRDSGGTLLASQLDLPRTTKRYAAPVSSKGVRLASADESLPALEPTPAEGPARGNVLPRATQPQRTGEALEQGPMMQQGEMVEGVGQPVDENGQPMVVPEGVDPLYLDGGDGLNFGGGPTCGSGICGGGCGSRPTWYARGEYLLWWFEGMRTPPLVVEGADDGSGNFVMAAPVYGGDRILDRSRSGARFEIGYWLDDCGRCAIEGDWLGFGRINEHFEDTGNGTDRIIGRPFIDLTPGSPAVGLPVVEDVSFPNSSRGSVTVDSSSEFQSAGIRLRRNLCCTPGCQTCCGDAVTCGSGVGCDGGGCDGLGCGIDCCPLLQRLRGATRHVDIIYGFRWAQLNEALSITENVTALQNNTRGVPADTNFVLNDRFASDNQFLGGEIGFITEWEKRRWSLELLSKLALGNTRQRVFIDGNTDITLPGQPPEPFPQHGLLVQPSNAGIHEQNQFSVIPQIGLTTGYLVTERLRLTFGYTLLYWTRVARPGDQIDLEVNQNQIAPPVPPSEPARPQLLVVHDTDIWAQGINVGLDYRW